ncbi:hypothetical protein AVEN_136610-1 [Araneus ventricosus]|uniref:Uncharacterized protein n=1 Tax=Araneus ventricosus TaxID=182803 RepID=A0A4Y2CB61_ARAVE|nr:hypothetical protein AVEN_136610-1 [Araneus ventricosus]
MNNAHQKIQHHIGLILLKHEGLADFLGLMVVSLLAPLHRHCPRVHGGHVFDSSMLDILFLLLFFSLLQINVYPFITILFGEVGWLFYGIRIVLFGPECSSLW